MCTHSRLNVSASVLLPWALLQQKQGDATAATAGMVARALAPEVFPASPGNEKPAGSAWEFLLHGARAECDDRNHPLRPLLGRLFGLVVHKVWSTLTLPQSAWGVVLGGHALES